MTRGSPDERGSMVRVFYDVLMVTSAQFWIVAAAPFYIGWFLATRELWPDGRVILGMVIAGPMMAGATLAYNAYTDVRVDLFNPRKAHLAYVTGWISPRLVLNMARGLALLGAALSLLLSFELFVLVIICLTLSFLYSNPWTKLKSVAGGDLLLNMVGIGILMPMAGWATSGRPLVDLPYLYMLTIFFALGSLYCATLVPDYEADRRAGYRTLAVTLGQRVVVWMGFVFLAASIAINVASGLLDYVLPPGLILRIWPVYVAQLGLYLVYAREVSYQGMLALIGTQCIGHGVGVGFMMYTLSGIWPVA